MKKTWVLGIGVLSIVGLLSGCGSKTTPLVLDHETVAKGRFVEEEIEVPPELQKSRYLDCLTYDNKIEILSYSKEDSQYYDYIYDGENWKAEPLNLGNIAAKITIRGVAQNTEGKKYVYGYDENKKYHILPTEQNEPDLLSNEIDSLSSKDNMMRIDHVLFQKNGSTLVSTQDKAILFSKEGKILHEFAQDYNEGSTRESVFLSDDVYITILNQKLVRYSLKDGELQELNSDMNFEVSSCLFSDKEGSIFVANADGLYHMNDNSTIVEKVIDGTLNSMSLQTDVIRKFLKNDQDIYFCIMSSWVDGNISVFKYIYNSEISTLPQDTLTVYSLNDSPSLRQAAALMQRKNPNVRVDIRTALGEGYESLSEDIIRSLNAELLNGNGADILVLDGLPKDAYKEKGMLLNLKDLYDEIQKESPLLSNIVKNYIDSQGNVYYLPIRFKMPVVFGEKDAVEALSLMAAPETRNLPTPILAVDNYGNLERLILNMCYNQVFPHGNSDLSEDGLKIYLENVKKIGESVQARVEFSPDEMELLGVDNQVSDIGNRRNGPVAFAQGKTQVGVENIGSIQDSILTFAALDGTGLEPSSLNGIFYPELMVGINKNTKNQEMAKDFIKVLYSSDIQDQDLSDGFGLLETAIMNLESIERETRMEITDYDGSTILSASWPTKEKRSKIINFIKSLRTPADIDPNIMSIITEYSQSYFDGSQGLKATIDLIMNKAALYNEE